MEIGNPKRVIEVPERAFPQREKRTAPAQPTRKIAPTPIEPKREKAPAKR